MEDLKQLQGEKLRKDLAYERKNSWTRISQQENEEVFKFCLSYRHYLDAVKTEREAVEWAESEAKEKRFVLLDDVIKTNKELHPGDRIYARNKGKNIILAVLGKEPLENGLNMIGSHVDVPRIDLKPNPLYEDCDLALLKTHYYGGIKKFQWTTIPLAIHGVIFKSDGTQVKVQIGEREDEPKFCITDLLPHLAKEQMDKKMSEGIKGEELNLLFGSIPYSDDQNLEDKIKINILKILHERYGTTEEDFQRAELEIIPALKSTDVGLDQSMIGAYGQDDRVCAYTSLQAI